MKLNKTNIQAALNVFELHQPRPENERKAGERSEPWYSFKLASIDDKNKFYAALSPVIMDSDVDNDTAYDWTVISLEKMLDILEDGEDLESGVGMSNRNNILEWADANTPIYNHELLEWIGKGSNYSLVDDSIAEIGKGESLINDIMSAYCLGLERHYGYVLDALKSI